VDLNLGELKQLVGREISSCLQPSRQHHLSNAEQQQLGKLSSSTEQLSNKPSAGTEQLPKLSSDVTLTKVAAPERLSEKDKETKVVSYLCVAKYFGQVPGRWCTKRFFLNTLETQ
jgi:hypothetical protein